MIILSAHNTLSCPYAMRSQQIELRSRLTIALLTFGALSKLCCRPIDSQADSVKLHEALSEFTFREQSTVELFAPLSTSVASLGADAYVHSASNACWFVVGFAFTQSLRFFKTLPSTRVLGTAYALMTVGAWFLRSDIPASSLTAVSLKTNALR